MRAPVAAVVLASSLLSPPARVTAAPPAPARFEPARVTPYFADGPAAEAARHFRLEEWAAAADGFAAYVQAHPKAADVLRARVLLAYAASKAGRFKVAADTFDLLAKSDPLLADYHHLWGGRASLQLGAAREALARGKKVPPTSPLDGEARLLRAEADRALADWAGASAEYQGYLDAYPTSWRKDEARFRLAEALEQLGKTDAAREAFRTVYLESPETWGPKAEAHLTGAAREFDAAALVTRATRLFDAMRNEASEAEWKRVLAAPKLSDQLTCLARFHVAQSVFKQRDRVRAAPLFDAAADACKQANDEDLLTKALYQGGRSWGTKGDKDVAMTKKGIERFEAVWREHATHSYADDARLREAELLDQLKDEAKATELLSGLPAAFPTGDQRGEALWRLAFRAFRKGQLDEAQKWLETELKALPREDGWWEAGRTLYWLGRIADQKGDAAQAQALFQRAVREYPLSYYSLAALNRLRDQWPDTAVALVGELLKDPGDKAGWSFTARPLFAEPGWARAVELARLGLGAEAKRELAALGVTLPQRPKNGEATVEDPAKSELLWAVSLLYARAGEPGPSHHVPRYLLTEWARHWPLGAHKKEWLLAYPRGYAELIEPHATKNGQPPALEFAIVREESAFDPLLESFANAVGLTQLTASPAARFAQGLPHDRHALRDPVINVTIGARELGQLYKAFAGNAALAIAGYNAGEGAVRRWQKDPERAGLDLDAFVESIPYDETRGYTKRVLSSFFTYTWLAATPPEKPTRATVDALVPVLPFKKP